MLPAIRAEKLSKCYRLNGSDPDEQVGYRSLREDLARWVRKPLRWLGQGGGDSRGKDFWALKDVDFELKPGEVLGIVGRNGAGKSTLLKVLSRITKPTSGQVEIRGRVGSLLEVGTGFHPELSGRENIYLNGAILGMKRAEIDRKFDQIVAFAEVEKFLDTPVKRYSSGMYVRLAFAVAAHLEPEILVVDEVLAVGDAEFQRKCLNKMGDVAGEGRTILFVSHNMAAVTSLCTRAVLLSQGRLVRSGPVRDIVSDYLRAGDAVQSVPLSQRTDRSGAGRFRFESVQLLDADGHERDYAVTGEDLFIRLQMTAPPGDGPLPAPLDVSLILRDYQGQRITEVASYFTGQSPTSLADARTITCHLPRLPLLAGQYRLDLYCATSTEKQDAIADAAPLRVEPGNYFRNYTDVRLPRAEKHGCIMIPQVWSSTSAKEKSRTVDHCVGV